ncbi:MAG: hypothetical protein COV91_05655 [Candidatus Taylorbacteria bacterium CG11_big_fil_rev_8_21_14_0_20_46_11]|uniref:Septum formation initiator n=1 Tax=Candidatus Taylorbacteria bacterium CG11_big_fil_rev_8_21_14_0_20_46_11 TaxID=1975025 RepID=A0A2H0KC30_9BACT|nr:MAG: hypothetical protein COV91_05655 [Candidatus Taylorbacteria bacterium CG11_big_fil_rev_8_21_14_0_20_46_11]
MREYQRKKNIRRFIYSPLTLIVLVVLILFMGKATWSVYSKERDSKTSLSRASEQLASLIARKDNLTEQIERLRTPEGVEAEIRGQFQVAKPGERMVVVVEEEKVSEVPKEKQSFVSKFFNFFK